VVELRVHLREVERAIAARLSGSSGSERVVWAQEGSELLVHVDSLRAQLTGGYLVTSFTVECVETGRHDARVLLFLGQADSSDGLAAGAGLDPDLDARIVSTWGEALVHAAWEGVLDVVEAAIAVASQAAEMQLRLAGLAGHEDALGLWVAA